MSDRRRSDLIGDAMPKKGKVSEVCKEFTVYEDGALALRLQDEEISNHYSGNRMRNAIVRSDFPCAKQQQTQEQVKAQMIQDVLNHQAALDATFAAKIQEELIQQEQKKLSKLKIKDEQMVQQIMLDEQRSHPNNAAPSQNVSSHRHTNHQPDQGPRSPLRQQSPIYQNLQNQWSPSRVAPEISRVAPPETSPKYQSVEPPWSQSRASPQTPSPSYTVEPSAWSPARSVSKGQVPSPQVHIEPWSVRATSEIAGPESRQSPVRTAHQRSSPEHSQYSPSRGLYSPRTGIPPVSPTGHPSTQQRMVSPSMEQQRMVSPSREQHRVVSQSREQQRVASPSREHQRMVSPSREQQSVVSPSREQQRVVSPSREQQRVVSPSREQVHPPRTPPKYVGPPSSHSSPESHNSRSGDSSYLTPAADLCVDIGIPLHDEEEERKRQEERDADLAARLQAEEDKDKGAAEMRDALMAIEQQDRELAHMLHQQEKARVKRAREKARLKKKQKEAESQRQHNSDAKVEAGGDNLSDVTSEGTEGETARTTDANYKHDQKHKSTDILESAQLTKSTNSTPSKVSNGSKMAHVSNIATMIDPTYHQHGSDHSTYHGTSSTSYESPPPTPTTKTQVDPLSPLSHRLLYEDDGPVPPYMPIQGHKRNELLEKKKRRREKESCKQQ